jgi:hypothetical protein
MHRLYGHQTNVDANIIEGKCGFVDGRGGHLAVVVRFARDADASVVRLKNELRRHAVGARVSESMPPDCVHASVDACEAQRDIPLMTGSTVREILRGETRTGRPGWAGEWVEGGGWKSTGEMLTPLGSVVKYVRAERAPRLEGARARERSECEGGDLLRRERASAKKGARRAQRKALAR